MSKVCGRCGNSGFKVEPILQTDYPDRHPGPPITSFKGLSITCPKCERRDLYTLRELTDLLLNDSRKDEWPPKDGSLPG